MKKDAKRTLLLIGLVCAAPVVVSYFMFYVAQPSGTMNYGDLVEPRPLPATTLAGLDGKPFELAQLKGRWVMLTVDSSRCEDRCRQKLYYMRQVRTAQGKEMERVERVWLLRDQGQPDAKLLADYPGMHVARLSSDELLEVLPAKDGGTAAHVYLVDPLGNVMLRYPEGPEPKRMIKDLERLLKYSRLG